LNPTEHLVDIFLSDILLEQETRKEKKTKKTNKYSGMMQQAHNFRHLDFLQLQRLQLSPDFSPDATGSFRLYKNICQMIRLWKEHCCKAFA
jgi:hypothetical protein